MTSYTQLLSITLPVFSLFALGIGVRKVAWYTKEAESSVLKLVVNLLYPCLIFKSVLGNTALRETSTLVGAPLAGAAFIVLGMLVGLQVGKLLGLHVGTGLRTYAFAVGINNYAYMAIPLVDALWGRETTGVLLVFNVGVEAALWTFGILMLSGLSPKEGWKKLFNPVVASLAVGVALNLLHVSLPEVVTRIVDALAACAIPLGLLSAGAAVTPYLARPSDLYEHKVSLSACALRLGLLPLTTLALAWWLPFSPEMKRVLVVQAAMPAGMLPLVIAGHYGGQPLVAARIIISTTLLGLLLIPLWLTFGLGWVIG